jgi:aldehyde:ferredoxin oxidoreductase
MFEGGYLGKILRVNLSTREHRIERLKENEVLKLLGALRL